MTNAQRQHNARIVRRVARVRAKIVGTLQRPRFCVTRTLAHVYAQIIDDASGKTLIAVRDVDIPEADRKGKNKQTVSALVGTLAAERAQAKGITQVVFDRRDKKYHGRVRAVAEAARLAGLIF